MLKNKICKCGKVADMVYCKFSSSCDVSCNEKFGCTRGLKYYCLDCYENFVMDNKNIDINQYKFITTFKPFAVANGKDINGFDTSFIVYRSYNKLYIQSAYVQWLQLMYSDGNTIDIDVAIRRLKTSYKDDVFFLQKDYTPSSS